MPSVNILSNGIDCCAVRGVPSSLRAFSTIFAICCRSFLFRLAGSFTCSCCFALPFFSIANNGSYLLFCVILPDQGGIVVIRLIRPYLGADEFALDKMLSDDLKGLSILFIHSKEEHRKHDDDHTHSGKTQIANALDSEERRHPDECRRSEANELPFCQAKEHLGLYPCQVTGNGNIGSQSLTSSLNAPTGYSC